MFFKFTTLIVLLSFVSIAFCAIALSLPSVHPDHPGKCWDNDTAQAYAPNAVFTAPHCVRQTCLNDFSFEYASCGVVQTEPPCYVDDGDLSLPYPDCCPQVKCNA